MDRISMSPDLVTVGCWITRPTPRMPTSGGLMRGVKFSMSYEERLVREKVLPESSATRSSLALDLRTSSRTTKASSSGVLLSASRMTGTRSPSGTASAKPRLMVSKICTSLSVMWAFARG